MDSEGCWSTVVSSAAERRALGLPDTAGWMLQCRLGIGHRGNHATDGSAHPRADRRAWLEWNDFDPQAQSLIERNPCPVRSLDNAPCLYFHGHPGTHQFARSNGHAPTALSGMAARGGSPRPAPIEGPRASHAPTTSGPATGDLPVAGRDGGRSGSHRLPDGFVPDQGVGDRVVADSAELPTADPGYRGGRRSTDSAPPHDQVPYHGRRHSFDTPPPRPFDAAPPPQYDTAPPVRPNPPVTSAPSTPAPPIPQGASPLPPQRPLLTPPPFPAAPTYPAPTGPTGPGPTGPGSTGPGPATQPRYAATERPGGPPPTPAAPITGSADARPGAGAADPIGASGELGAVSEALSEVATALERLAAALRRD